MLVTGSRPCPQGQALQEGSGTSAGTVTHPEGSWPQAGTEDGTAALPAHLGCPASFCQPNLRHLLSKHALSRHWGRFPCRWTHARAGWVLREEDPGVVPLPASAGRVTGGDARGQGKPKPAVGSGGRGEQRQQNQQEPPRSHRSGTALTALPSPPLWSGPGRAPTDATRAADTKETVLQRVLVGACSSTKNKRKMNVRSVGNALAHGTWRWHVPCGTNPTLCPFLNVSSGTEERDAACARPSQRCLSQTSLKPKNLPCIVV